jgi:2-amino-4-hydroxy-6-hydroxymethyldihydropteridine diphosphokinase / dihydropteroate synthase
MRLYRPATRVRGFGHVKSINGRPKPWSEMAPSRNYSSSIEGVKVTSWPQSSHRNNDPTSAISGTEPRSKKKAYIALGSNLGDRIGMIERACKKMSARGIKILRTSSLWETEPMYVLDQNSFVNGACEVGLVLILSSAFCMSSFLPNPILRTIQGTTQL